MSPAPSDVPQVGWVAVETLPEGGLEVRWRLEQGPAVVDVGIGASPDPTEHSHKAAVGPGVSGVRLPGMVGRRSFVSVAPRGGGTQAVAADRRIRFVGVPNFRDIGGYPTRSGGTVRWGQIFRASALDGLGRSDLALFTELGIRTVFDLRSNAERELRPSVIPARSLPISGQPDARGARHRPNPPRSAAEAEQRLLELYCGLLDHGAPKIGSLLSALATGDRLPAVIHCQAGKDRTGVVVAVLLVLLGVDPAVVIEDYVLTDRYLERERLGPVLDRLLILGYSEDAAAALLGTSPPAMAGALHRLEHEYGGVERYLTGPARMPEEHLDDLRRRLVGTRT